MTRSGTECLVAITSTGRRQGPRPLTRPFDLASPYSNDYIIGGLEEWTMYDVRMEAYNEEYSGPSSGAVSGWTHEDGRHALISYFLLSRTCWG